MRKPLMSGIKLYREAVLKKQHAGKTFVVHFRDLIDLEDKDYNSIEFVKVDSDYYAKQGHALVVKGSNTNLLCSPPRRIDALMNGIVLEEVEG